MPNLSLPLAAALLLALVPGAATAQRERYQAAQVLIEQRVTVRVPRLSSRAGLVAVPLKPVIWVEKKGPRCVALGGLAGALVTRPDAVDLVLAGGTRVRAQLDDDCPSLAFYSGFYLRAARDGRVCAGRDSIRSRAGKACEIEKFRTLVAKR